MKEYIVFRDKKTGRELCSYSVSGTFEGERQATIELLASEQGIPAEQIKVTIERRG